MLPTPAQNTPPPALPDVPVAPARARLVAWAVFLLTFAVYAATLCRTIYTGDDGDFLTAMATGGISHPTGYPLFTLVGRTVIALIPLGSPALRINILTALGGAASVGVMFRFLYHLLTRPDTNGSGARVGSPLALPVAVGGAGLLAFAPTLWQQSLSCEVYSFTCLFLAALLWLAARWHETPADNRQLARLTFLYGLSLTNHLTLALFLPGFVVFVLARRPAILRDGRLFLCLVGLFALPLLLYLYLPFAARSHPPVAWGNPQTWPDFKAHVTGEMFRDRMGSGGAVFAHQSGLYAHSLVAEFGGPLALGFAAVGAVVLWSRRRALAALLGYIALADIAYATNYDVFDIYVYFLPSYFVVAACIAVGLHAALTALFRRVALPRRGEGATHLLRPLAVLLCLLPVLPLATNWAEADKSGNYLEDDFDLNILRSAPPHALVVTASNVTFSLWYHKFVLGERPDVTPIYSGMTRGMTAYGGWYYQHLHDQFPAVANVYPPGGWDEGKIARGEFLRDLIRQSVARGVPVIVIPDARYNRNKIGGRFPSFDDLLAPDFVRVPWGVGERLYLRGQAPSPAQVTAANAALWATFQTRGLYDGGAHADPLQEHIARRYAEAALAAAALAEQAGRPDLARAHYERVLKLYPNADEARAGQSRTGGGKVP